MKSTVVAVLVAVSFGLTAGGPALAAGKLGGAGGADEFSISLPDKGQDDAEKGDGDSPTTLGGKVGGGMDRPAQLGANLDTASADATEA
jgi:hypothetical protein